MGMKKMVAMVLVLVAVLWGVNFSSAEVTKVKIASPASAAVFHPGDKLLVKISAPTQISKVVINIGRYNSTIIAKPPYEFSFVIPSNIPIGQLKITASAVPDELSSFGSDEITINIKPVGSKEDKVVNTAINATAVNATVAAPAAKAPAKAATAAPASKTKTQKKWW